MKYKVSMIIMSLLIIGSLSSFLWVNSLLKAVENGHANQSQITYIRQFGFTGVLYKRLNTFPVDDLRWQNVAKILAKSDGELAFKLAKHYMTKQEEGRANNRNIELWLSQAIRLKHDKARIILARVYVDNKKLSAARKVLIPISSDAFAIKMLIEISMLTGDNKAIAYYSNQLRAIAIVNQNEELQAFYQKLKNYQVIKSPNTESENVCMATIAPFATNLDNLTYFEKLISSAKLVSLQPYLCFSPVKYISNKELDCQHAKNEAIRCNESIWNDKSLALNNRFVAVLVDEGGANVNSGILYIDSHDNEEVFFHELAHLFGFIDEYPLPKKHARCKTVQKTMFSHNIAVLPRFYQGSREIVRERILKQLPWAKYISKNTPLVSDTEHGWKLGTISKEGDIIGAFSAETCNKKDFVSVQPLNRRTAMRYYEEKFPALYFQMLTDNPEKFLMPNYKENVTEALTAKK
jgi:hypothetical protein